MAFKDDAQTIIAMHLSPEEMRAARLGGPGRAQAMEAGTRALAALRAIRLERRMRESNSPTISDETLSKLERTLKADVSSWLALTSCPHCNQHVGV